jgi:hypothetical protein
MASLALAGAVGRGEVVVAVDRGVGARDLQG